MMTSSVTSITVSKPHNPAKKTDVFRKKHSRIGSSCVSAAAYFQRHHLRISILYLQCLDLTKSLGESCRRGSPVILTINDWDVIRVTVPK